MTYSRDFLINDVSSEGKEFQPVSEDLINKLLNGEYLSLAEEEFACSVAGLLRDEDSVLKINPFDIKGCENYCFRKKYLTYFSNLDCYGKAYNFEGVIDIIQKNKDREYLEKEFQNWYHTICSKISNDKLMERVAVETKHQLKELERYCKKLSIGSNRQAYLTKSIVLHGKYIYLQVKEYYQELGKDDDIIDLCGNKILIDSYCYVHILFRHYSAIIKEYQLDKTYHYSQDIDFKNIPKYLQRILELFNENNSLKDIFNNRSINFEFNTKPYTIWFRPMTINRPGKIQENFLRVQTFYPVELPSDIKRINSLSKVKIDSSITFLI